MRPRSSYSVSPPRVTVSRSHSGQVTSYVQSAFGNSTTIIPAGGAGELKVTDGLCQWSLALWRDTGGCPRVCHLCKSIGTKWELYFDNHTSICIITNQTAVVILVRNSCTFKGIQVFMP